MQIAAVSAVGYMFFARLTILTKQEIIYIIYKYKGIETNAI